MTTKYGSIWKSIRRAIVKRDGHKCRFCGAERALVVHHLRPLRMGGDHRDYNLLSLCKTCHALIHADIDRNGLATIPGPEFEPYREYLTNPDDAARYFDQLKADGLG